MVALATGAKEEAGTTAPNTGIKGELTMLLESDEPIPASVDVLNNPWANIYKQAFPNVTIKWQFVNYNDIGRVRDAMIAAGNVPDVFAGQASQARQYAADSVILPLSAPVRQYAPNLVTMMPKDSMDAATVDGELYAIPNPQSPYGAIAFYVRQDWLDNLNAKAPKTMDEMLDLMRKFTKNDPDGNGKNDTWGIVGNQSFYLVEDVFTYSFLGGPSAFWAWNSQGKLVPNATLPENKDMLIYMKKVFDEGLIDPKVWTDDVGTWVAKCQSGSYGFIGLLGATAVTSTWAEALRKTNPNAKYVPVLPPTGPTGKRGSMLGAPTNQVFFVSRTSRNPEAYLQILNWYLTDGKEKMRGKEGIDYTIVDGYKIPTLDAKLTPDQLKEKTDNFYRKYYQLVLGRPTESPNPARLLMDPSDLKLRDAYKKAGHPERAKEYYDAIQYQMDYGVKNARTVPIPAEYVETVNALVGGFGALRNAYLRGEASLAAYDELVKKFIDNGGNAIIDKMTELQKKAGGSPK